MANSKHLMRRFPFTKPKLDIVKGEGAYLIDSQNNKYFDMTAGYSSCVALGHGLQEVINAIKAQYDKISYISSAENFLPESEELAELITIKSGSKLDRVWFNGGSGSEALEYAQKTSFLYHQANGMKEKTWFISREEAYHGITLFSNSITNLDIYNIYKPLNPKNIGVVSQHNKYKNKYLKESDEEFVNRQANELEDKILEIGPEKVAGFVAETMLGQLVGNVPPCDTYWKEIRKICSKYSVHIILDEVYCGLGRSGQKHCYFWDNFSPDFVCNGKMLAAGYAPIGAMMTSSEIESKIVNEFGRILLAGTYESHPPGIAAAHAVQKICLDEKHLSHVRDLGNFIQSTLKNELHDHPFYKNVRGRGLLISLEHKCNNQNKFNEKLTEIMLSKYNIIMSIKFHRTNFTPPSIATKKELEILLNQYIFEFKKLSKHFN